MTSIPPARRIPLCCLLLASVRCATAFVQHPAFYTPPLFLSRQHSSSGQFVRHESRIVSPLGLVPSNKSNNKNDATKDQEIYGGKGYKSPGDYKDKLAKLDEAIAGAEEERQQLLRLEFERYSSSKPQQQTPTLDSIDDNGNMINHREGLVPIDDWTPRDLQRPPVAKPSSFKPSQQQQQRSFTTRSQVSRSDAGTLVIEITPQGISSGTLLNGAFSVAWFSAIIPATLTALTGGLFGMALFMLPFWAAGGMVAKQAVVDPFVSNKLTLGEYAWSVESLLGSKNRGPAIQKEEGSTQDLQGSRVEISVVVNNVPQYHLCLYNKNGVTKLGLGLPEEELEKVAKEINEYLEGLSSSENGSSPPMPWKVEQQ